MELETVCAMIQRADSSELSTIIRFILCRYAELFEGEEVRFLSLPKHDNAQRRRIIEDALRLELQHQA